MAGVEEWKKFFERERSGFNIFDTIHCAITVASLLKPEEFKRHREEIVAEIMVATTQQMPKNKVNNSTIHQASKIKLDKQSSSRPPTLSKVDDKIVKTSSSTATGVSDISLDEKSLHQQKLEISKRKLQEGYQRVAAGKKQRTAKVLGLNELPKKVLGRSSHLHGQNPASYVQFKVGDKV